MSLYRHDTAHFGVLQAYSPPAGTAVYTKLDGSISVWRHQYPAAHEADTLAPSSPGNILFNDVVEVSV